MHNALEGRKIDVIRANSTAFVQIDCDEALSPGSERACSYGASYASVMGDAEARVIEEPHEKVRGLTLLMRAQTGRDFAITEAMAASVSIIRIDVQHFQQCILQARCKHFPLLSLHLMKDFLL